MPLLFLSEYTVTAEKRPVELRPLVDSVAEVKGVARRSANYELSGVLAEFMHAALTRTRIKLTDVPVALQ